MAETKIIIGDDIPLHVKEYHQLTEEYLKKSTQSKLSKSIDIDVLTKVVYSKILEQKLINTSKSEPKESLWSRIFFYLILTAISLFFMWFMDKSNKKSGMQEKIKDPHADDSSKKIFSFTPASKFYKTSYFGNINLMKMLVSKITKAIHCMSKMDVVKLNKVLSAPQRNFLFYGVPGTGKTIFIKKFTGLLDLNIKINLLQEKLGKKEFKKLKKKELHDHLKNMRSYVRIIFLTPSAINDKYMGESEKRVRMLFQEASDTQGYMATIIFFDEMDSFFNDRNTFGNENNIKVQTELLNMIGGSFDQANKGLFLFGATNLIEKIDKAFLRRFAHKFEFKKPEENEIRELVKEQTSEWKSDDKDMAIENVVTEIATAAFDGRKAMTQAEIIETINNVAFDNLNSEDDLYPILLEAVKKFVSKDEEYDPYAFNSRELNRYFFLDDYIAF